MLLVSSLDVFDCCGLAWGRDCPHADPDRVEAGRRDLGALGPFPCPEHEKPGPGGKFVPLWGTCDKPRPGSEPLALSPMDRKTEGAGKGHWPWPGVWGASGLFYARGIPCIFCMSALHPRGCAWKIQEHGRPSPALLLLRGSCWWTVVLVERDTGVWGFGGLCPGLLPPPLPGAAQTTVLRPLKPLVLSPPQETWLRVWVVSPSPLSHPLPTFPVAPRRGTRLPSRRQRKEKVFYIWYLFNIPF